jgi:hypothetical protein
MYELKNTLRYATSCFIFPYHRYYQTTGTYEDEGAEALFNAQF